MNHMAFLSEEVIEREKKTKKNSIGYKTKSASEE